MLSYTILIEQILIQSKVIKPKSNDVNSTAALSGNEYGNKEYEELFIDTASGDVQPSYTYVRDAIDVADSLATRSGLTDFVMTGGWSGSFAFDDAWNYQQDWLSKANEFSLSSCNTNYHLCTCKSHDEERCGGCRALDCERNNGHARLPLPNIRAGELRCDARPPPLLSTPF